VNKFIFSLIVFSCLSCSALLKPNSTLIETQKLEDGKCSNTFRIENKKKLLQELLIYSSQHRDWDSKKGRYLFGKTKWSVENIFVDGFLKKSEILDELFRRCLSWNSKRKIYVEKVRTATLDRIKDRGLIEEISKYGKATDVLPFDAMIYVPAKRLHD